ncbi:MAG: sugar ABC transporter permease [Chloroflexota bacterium]|nr:MAG: sugar ABC transporter permease [Chloroflexota bacterium]
MSEPMAVHVPASRRAEATRARRRRRVRWLAGWAIFYAILLGGAFALTIPLAWTVLASFKTRPEIFAVPFRWLPASPQWSNYTEALTAAPFAGYFLNSAFIAIATTLSNLFFASLAGYGFARYNFWGRNFFFLAILSTLMVPFQVIMVPLYILVRDLGWLNTYQGMIVPGAITAFGVFLMRQFIQTIPNELLDAARLDGASEFGIYWRIVLPLARPALSALAIFTFLESWNALLWPLIVITDSDLRPLQLGLAEFTTQNATDYPLLLAASVTALLPIVILFLVLRREFVRGIVTTGLK